MARRRAGGSASANGARYVTRIVGRAREYPPHHGLEERERFRAVVGIEGALVPGRAEVRARGVPRMIAEALASVAVAAQVVHVVVVLKQPVLGDDPGHL